MNLVFKLVTLLVWIIIAINLVAPFAAPWQTVFWYLGGALVVGHAIECVVFAGRVRAAGGNAALHFLQVLVFGVFHAQTLPKTK